MGGVFRRKDNVWCDMFLRHISIRHMTKGEVVLREFEVPPMFYVLHTGVLKVEKQIEVAYSNLWPAPQSKEWTHQERLQRVTNILQHITTGMYFGEEEILLDKPISCRVTVESKKAILFGFNRAALDEYFDEQARKDWLANHVTVRFPHEDKVRNEQLIDWKVKSLGDHALLDGLLGTHLPDCERDAYLEWDVRRRQHKLRPLFEAIKARKTYRPRLPAIKKEQPAPI